MSAQILDGKEVAAALLARVADQIKQAGNPQLTLATVVVGDDPRSRLYINHKMKKAQHVGMHSRLLQLPTTASQDELQQRLSNLSHDANVHGILLQLPLPSGFDVQKAIACIAAEKDVDGLTQKNMGALLRNEPGLVPCTPLGVMRILEHYNIATAGRTAVIIGRSFLVGLPQFILLSRRGVDATVTLCHSATSALATHCRSADIIVAAAGSPAMIKAEFVKSGAVVIDVGVSQVDGKPVGDVDYHAVCQVAAAVTPMPGGTGPVTVACLIENTWTAARMQAAVV